MRRSQIFLWCWGAAIMGVFAGGCIDVTELLFDRAGGDQDGGKPDGGTEDGGKSCDQNFVHAAASSFHDDFMQGDGDPDWLHDPSCASYANGEIVVGTVPGFCRFTTLGVYHLTCDSVTVKVPALASRMPGVQTFLYASRVNGDQLWIIADTGFIVGSNLDAGIKLDDDSYDPTRDLWWRVSEADGKVTLETSDGGPTWQKKGSGSLPPTLTLDDVRIELGAGGPVGAGTARFDCYNEAPESCNK
jgi:hypothetical protein